MPNPRVDAIGSSLLPSIIDQLAQSEPDTLWAEYPTSPSTLDDGFQQITYRQFSSAVNSSARRIQKVLGRRDTGETLAYLAPNDPRCSIAVIAAMKAGFNVGNLPCLLVLADVIALPALGAKRFGCESQAVERRAMLSHRDHQLPVSPNSEDRGRERGHHNRVARVGATGA